MKLLLFMLTCIITVSVITSQCKSKKQKEIAKEVSFTDSLLPPVDASNFLAKKKKPTPPAPVPQPEPSAQPQPTCTPGQSEPNRRPQPACVWLDYKGYGTNHIPAYQLTVADKQMIKDSLNTWWNKWDITFTEDSVLFLTYKCDCRQRAVIYGDSNYYNYGISSVNSMIRNEGTEWNPAWISEFRAYLNTTAPIPPAVIVARTISHELGHAVGGNWHQTLDSCVNNYKNGPMMGWCLYEWAPWVIGNTKDGFQGYICVRQDDEYNISLNVKKRHGN